MIGKKDHICFLYVEHDSTLVLQKCIYMHADEAMCVHWYWSWSWPRYITSGGQWVTFNPVQWYISVAPLPMSISWWSFSFSTVITCVNCHSVSWWSSWRQRPKSKSTTLHHRLNKKHWLMVAMNLLVGLNYDAYPIQSNQRVDQFNTPII